MTITKKNKNKTNFTKLKCSPKTKKKDYTCYSDESLIKIKNIWNQKHPNKIIKSNKSLEIWKDLKNNLNDVCSTEACWLKQKFMEIILIKNLSIILLHQLLLTLGEQLREKILGYLV